MKANKLTVGQEVLEWLDTFGCSQEGTVWTCYAYQPKKDPRNLAGYPRFSPKNDGIAMYVDSTGMNGDSTITVEGFIKFNEATSMSVLSSLYIVYSLMF